MVKRLDQVLVVVSLLLVDAAAFSTGGADSGVGQTCDAVNPCTPSWRKLHTAAGDPYTGDFVHECPTGMTKVSGPRVGLVDPLQGEDSARRGLYTIRSGDSGLASSDPTAYTPGKLLQIHIRVTQKMTQRRYEREGFPGIYACYVSVYDGTIDMCTTPAEFAGGHISVQSRAKIYIPASEGGSHSPQVPVMESAKYVGLLLYAVDASGEKVGSWELPPEFPARFWTPPDPGCDGKALMHRDASPKSYHHTFFFRAPPAGAGTLAFHALLKQGDTNKGAFYWPLAPAMSDPGQNLALTEDPAPVPSAAGWLQATSPDETCDEVCAAASVEGKQRACDAALLASASASAADFHDAIADDFSCNLPVVSSCDPGAPSFAHSGSAMCYYHDNHAGRCGASAASAAVACADKAAAGHTRLCPCTAALARRQRRLGDAVGDEVGKVASSPKERGGTESAPLAANSAVPVRVASSAAVSSALLALALATSYGSEFFL